MKKLTVLILAILAAASSASTQPGDREEPSIYYDIYVQDSCLSVWVDLAPFLTSRVVERLRDGIELAIEYRAELVTPRRFWGDHTVVGRSKTFKLSFRQITNEFVMSNPDSSRAEMAFASQEELSNVMSELEGICLGKIRQFSPESRYSVVLKVTTISLTDLNLAETPPDSSGSESPVRFLFRHFLRLTDYGRYEVTTRTRPFLLTELEEID
jgi:hypothetical protein